MFLVVIAFVAFTVSPALSAPMAYGYENRAQLLKHHAYLLGRIPPGLLGRIPISPFVLSLSNSLVPTNPTAIPSLTMPAIVTLSRPFKFLPRARRTRKPLSWIRLSLKVVVPSALRNQPHPLQIVSQMLFFHVAAVTMPMTTNDIPAHSGFAAWTDCTNVVW
jgi:hypothetical protein